MIRPIPRDRLVKAVQEAHEITIEAIPAAGREGSAHLRAAALMVILAELLDYEYGKEET